MTKQLKAPIYFGPYIYKNNNKNNRYYSNYYYSYDKYNYKKYCHPVSDKIDFSYISFRTEYEHNNTILHYVSMYQPENIISILNHPLLTEELFNATNDDGYTALYMVLHYNPEYFKYFLNHRFMNKAILKKYYLNLDKYNYSDYDEGKDLDREYGNMCITNNFDREYYDRSQYYDYLTCLQKIIMDEKYCTQNNNFELLLNSKYCDTELLNTIYRYNDTIVHLVSDYCPKYLEILLDHPLMTEELLNKENIYGRSILLKMCYDYKCLEYLDILLKHPLMNKTLFNKKDSWNCHPLFFFCTRRTESIKSFELLINHPLMTEELLNISNSNQYSQYSLQEIYNSYIFLISEHSPIYLKQFLKHPLVSIETINCKTNYNSNYLHIICKKNPTYIFDAIAHNRFNIELINDIDDYDKKPVDYLENIPVSLLPLIENNNETKNIINAAMIIKRFIKKYNNLKIINKFFN